MINITDNLTLPDNFLEKTMNELLCYCFLCKDMLEVRMRFTFLDSGISYVNYREGGSLWMLVVGKVF